MRGAELGLKLLEAVDPMVQASVSVDFPRSAEDVQNMSYDQLRELLRDEQPKLLEAPSG